MKKGLFFATTLAMALGVGVAVGAHQAQAKPAEAANTTIYLKPGVWNTASAKFYIWNWSNNTDGVTVAMSEVPTDAGVFKATIDSSKTNVIFKRIAPGGTGEEWSGDNFWNQSADLVFSSTKPCYTISGWGQSDGSWGTYSEPAAASVYKYSLNGATAVTMEKGSGSEYTTGDDPIEFKKGDVVSFLKDDAAYSVEPKDDDQYTKVKSVASGLEFVQDYNGVLYLNTSSNKLWAGPFDDGYYLMGVGDNWDIKDAISAPLESGENPKAYVAQDVTLAKDAEIKMVSVPESGKTITYYSADPAKIINDTDVDYDVVSEGEGAGNIKFNKAGIYDIYYNPESGWYSLVDTEWSQPVYTMQIGDKTPVTLIQNEDNHDEYMTAADFAFKAGEQVKFFKNGVIIDAALKEDNQYTKLFVADAEEHILEFAEAFEGKPVINVKTNKVWGGQFTPGYYLAGLGGEWNPKLAMPATSGPNEDGAYYFGGINSVANTEIKSVSFPNDNSELAWLNADPDKVTADEGITWEVVSEGEGAGNLKIKTAGTTYGVYVNPTTGYYSLVDEQEHVYTVKVGSTVYDLELNEETEYKIKDHVSVKLTAGEEVTVLKDGVDAQFARKKIGNNNLDANYEIIANGNGQVYVDLSAKTVFVGGLDFGGYHVLHGGNYVHMTQNLEPLDPSFREYYTEMISFKKDEEVRFIDTSAELDVNYAVIFDITKIDVSSAEGIAVVGEGEAARLVVQKDVNLAVYIKLKTNNDEVYFGEVSPALAAAKEFAENFNDDMESVCVYNNKDITPSAALVSAWGEQVEAFDKLPEQVQNILKAATVHDTINEIAEFIEKYEYIAGKYGDDLGEGYNFLEKDIQSSILFNGGLSSIMGSESSNVMIIVISIAATSALAFGMFLVFKKRKQK